MYSIFTYREVSNCNMHLRVLLLLLLIPRLYRRSRVPAIIKRAPVIIRLRAISWRIAITLRGYARMSREIFGIAKPCIIRNTPTMITPIATMFTKCSFILSLSQQFFGPERIRTPNLLVRSQALYPLSYGPNNFMVFLIFEVF